MLVNHPGGNYLFAPGGEAFSDGVVSAPGYEIVRVTLKELLPWRQGFDLIDAFLKEQGRPRQALCAIELRCARPFTAEGFTEFNQGYRSLVSDWRILVDGVNPMARTNVAPVVGPPPRPRCLPSPSPLRRPVCSGPPSWLPGPAKSLFRPKGKAPSSEVETPRRRPSGKRTRPSCKFWTSAWWTWRRTGPR